MAIFKAGASLRVVFKSQFRQILAMNGFKTESDPIVDKFNRPEKHSNALGIESEVIDKPVRGFEKPVNGFEKRPGGFDGKPEGFDKQTGIFERRFDSFERRSEGPERPTGGFERRFDSFEKKSEGYDRRSGGFERRSEGFERRSDGFDRRSDGFDRRSDGFDRRSDGFDRRSGGFNGRSGGFERNYDGFGRRAESLNKNSDGVLSESTWFGKRSRPLRPSTNKSGAKLLEQPVIAECGNLEFKTWDKFSEIDNLDPRLLEVLQNIGHNEMSPIQKYTFDILNRRLIDVLGSAETGSGKTLAFLIPILNNILSVYPTAMMADLKKNSIQMPLMLVMAPTRELVQQINSETRNLLQLTSLRAIDAIGGVSIQSQLRYIDNGCHALVATPGRLIDLVSRGALSLQYCHSLVLDEADRMLDMGFEPQIRQIINDFDLPKKGERQTSMFSATFPTDVMKLARELLDRNYGQILVGSGAGSREPTIPKSITQTVILCTETNIFTELFKLLESSTKKTIVFCNTKRDVTLLERFGQKRQLSVTSLHGDLSQRERDEQMNAFKRNEVRVLIATSVAARGIDVADVECVVNYGAPTSGDEYVHRVGRCGRMGRAGEAILLVTPAQLNAGTTARDLAEVLRKSEQEVPSFMVKSHGGAHQRQDSRYNSRENIGRKSYF